MMKTIVMAAGAAAMVLTTAGVADAGGRHAKKQRTSAARMTSPPQPIPYTQLEAYLSASPRERASRDWWGGSMAATGAAANVGATAPENARSASPDTSGRAPGQVNAPTDAGPGARGSNSPSSTSSSTTTPR